MLNYEFLGKIDYELLKRADLGSNLRFSDAISYIEKLVKGFLFFKGKESTLIESEREIITTIFSRFTELVEQIQSFQHQPNENVESAQNRRNKIIQNIKNTHKDFVLQVLSISNKLTLDSEGGNFQSRVEELSKIITNAQNQLNAKIQSFENTFNSLTQSFQNNANQFQTNFNSLIEQAKNKIREAEETNKQIKDFTVEKLVEKYGNIFSQQSRKNLVVAIISIALFVGFLITTIVLAFRFFTPILDHLANLKDNEIVRLEYIITNVVFRLTILGLFLIPVKEALKSYNINMRLYNLNKHRQNSLESFSTLISNIKDNDSNDRDTRNTIIKEIAQTIYSNQDDGYISKDKKQMSIAEITEIVKAFRG